MRAWVLALIAMSRLDLRAEQCVAFEGSENVSALRGRGGS